MWLSLISIIYGAPRALSSCMLLYYPARVLWMLLIAHVFALREPDSSTKRDTWGRLIFYRANSDIACQALVQPQFPGMLLENVPAESHGAKTAESHKLLGRGKFRKGEPSDRLAKLKCHDIRENPPADSPLKVLEALVTLQCSRKTLLKVETVPLAVAIEVDGAIITESDKAFCVIDEEASNAYRARKNAEDRARRARRAAGNGTEKENLAHQKRLDYQNEHRRAKAAAKAAAKGARPKLMTEEERIEAARRTRQRYNAKKRAEKLAAQAGDQGYREVAESSEAAQIRQGGSMCADLHDQYTVDMASDINSAYGLNLLANIAVPEQPSNGLGQWPLLSDQNIDLNFFPGHPGSPKGP